MKKDVWSSYSVTHSKDRNGSKIYIRVAIGHSMQIRYAGRGEY